ncbi:MAG: hypothetical protein DRJ32_02490 [Thermoprotei archaeon]|nr:MAG: hypothetical protein B6U94_06350 [Thermofilum sp. ex4484_79]RLE60694.1 MAG: hypothetical protein DRJ32_02490 [Thermoprotei archaeon]HDD64151.1 PIN domain-containing protein [Thermoprotei archaeon]
MNHRGLLLDTSYLLPIFGIDISLEMPLNVILNSGQSLFYNPVSLIEIKWVYYKLVRMKRIDLRDARKNYILGLNILKADERFRETPLTTPAIERVADILHDMGLNDYFDRMIAATSIVEKLKLITDDQELKYIREKYLKFIK